MGRISVGIIGCGRISGLHYPGYLDKDDAAIHAVCDVDEATARRRKEEWGADRYYTDYRDLLSNPDIDAVEILTPHHLHEVMVIDAARAGKHIALQKPMSTDLRSADAMLKAVKEAGVVFRVTDNYVFYPPIVLAKKMIENGDIGTPTNLRIKFISGGSGGWEVPAQAWQWRLGEAVAGRGMQTFDHGHHLWATAWYLLGEMERVVSWIDVTDGVVDSPATVMWKHREATAYGMCEYCHASQMHVPSRYYANDEWFEVTGTRGLISINRCTGNIKGGAPLSFFDGHEWHEHTDVEADWGEGFRGATHNFIASIKGEEKPLLSGDEARTVLRSALAVGLSSRLRREVHVDELDAAWPTLYALRRQAARLGGSKTVRSVLDWTWVSVREASLAPRARELTRTLTERFDPEAVPGWGAVVGLSLLAEGDVEPATFSLVIRDGRAVLEEGTLPGEADLTITVASGVWAALLLRKERLEAALLQGKLKIDGKAELALKLRRAFQL